MPYIDLRVQPTPTAQQAAILAKGITDAMVEEVGKRREVTAVRVASTESTLWTIGGQTCRGTTAYMDVKITAGSNNEEEKAALLQRLHALLVDTLGNLAEASYVVIHELPAQSWGYGGLTQAARAGGRL